MNKHVPTVLVYRIGQLGDTLVAMPAIEAIRAKHPEHRLVLLTDRHGDDIKYVSSWNVLRETGWFSEVIFYDVRPASLTNIRGLLVLVAKLLKLKPEKIFNLSPYRSKRQSIRDKLFFKLIALRSKYFAGRPNHEVLHCAMPLPQIDPEWRRLLSIVDGVSGTDFRLRIPTMCQNSAAEILHEEGIHPGQRLVAIGHGSKMASKKWPLENYMALGQRILASFPDVDILVFGGVEDTKEGNALCKEWGTRTHNLAGRLSIYESAAVLKSCVTYVGNDTGTMHLAAMVGTRCIALFSARDYPGKWHPYGIDHAILRAVIECEGCMLETCTHGNECMKKIGVDEVFNTVSMRLLTMAQDRA